MIKSIFKTDYSPKNTDFALLLLRVASGGFMLTHGIGKFSKLLVDDPIEFADPIGVGVTASLALAVFSEVFCAIFLMIGFATRLAAIPLMITMFVAGFIVHASDGFGKQELALLYLVTYFAIAITGAGRFSLDNLIYNKLNHHKTIL